MKSGPLPNLVSDQSAGHNETQGTVNCAKCDDLKSRCHDLETRCDRYYRALVDLIEAYESQEPAPKSSLGMRVNLEKAKEVQNQYDSVRKEKA